jgi:uncharacterized membrane protein YccC
VGITVVTVFDPLISRFPWTLWPVVGLLVVYGALTLPIHRLARLNFITALLVLMVGHATASPVHIALWRGLTLVMAVAISIPVSYLIFPVRSTHLMRDACYDIVGRGSELLAITFKALIDPKEPWNEYERSVQVRELRDDVIKLGALIDDARKEGMQMRHNKVRRIFITLYRIIHYLFSLTRLTGELRGNPLLAATSEGFIHTADKLQQLLGLWEAQLVHPPERLQLPDVEASLQEIEAVLEQRRQEGKYAPLRHTSAFFSLFHTVRSFANDLVEGIEELHQLQTEVAS